MNILVINNIDFSPYVVQRNYKIQNDKEYAKWIDGNRIAHRTVVREKVNGSFSLAFTTATDYDTFISAIDAATTADGYTEITLYVENEHSLMTINAFIVYSSKTVWTQEGSQTPAAFSVSVKLEQR